VKWQSWYLGPTLVCVVILGVIIAGFVIVFAGGLLDR